MEVVFSTKIRTGKVLPREVATDNVFCLFERQYLLDVRTPLVL